MPSPAEPQTERHRDSDLLSHHRLHADSYMPPYGDRRADQY